jgi:hypothetical protein
MAKLGVDLSIFVVSQTDKDVARKTHSRGALNSTIFELRRFQLQIWKALLILKHIGVSWSWRPSWIFWENQNKFSDDQWYRAKWKVRNWDLAQIKGHIFGNIMFKFHEFPTSRSWDISSFSGEGGRGFGKSWKFQSGQKCSIF